MGGGAFNLIGNMLTGGVYGLMKGDSPQDFLLNTATGGMYTTFAKNGNNKSAPQSNAYQEELDKIAAEEQAAKANEGKRKSELRQQMLGEIWNGGDKDDDSDLGGL